jgi:hypothetical protein
LNGSASELIFLMSIFTTLNDTYVCLPHMYTGYQVSISITYYVFSEIIWKSIGEWSPLLKERDTFLNGRLQGSPQTVLHLLFAFGSFTVSENSAVCECIAVFPLEAGCPLELCYTCFYAFRNSEGTFWQGRKHFSKDSFTEG